MRKFSCCTIKIESFGNQSRLEELIETNSGVGWKLRTSPMEVTRETQDGETRGSLKADALEMAHMMETRGIYVRSIHVMEQLWEPQIKIMVQGTATELAAVSDVLLSAGPHASLGVASSKIGNQIKERLAARGEL